MLKDPEHLAGSLRSLVDRFGPAVLDDPTRVRNLLLDDYGADARSDRSDIDALVSVLSLHVSKTEPIEFATTRVSSETGLSRDDALWALQTVRGITEPAAQAPRVPAPATVVTGHAGPMESWPSPDAPTPSPATVIVTDGAPGTERSAGGWPGAAKVLVGALAVVAIGLAVFGVTTMSKLGDVQDDLDAAEEQIRSVTGELDEVNEQTGEQTDSLGESIQKLTDENRQLEEENAALQSELDSTSTDLDAMSTPVPFSLGQVVPTGGSYRGSLTSSNCSGWGDNAGVCSSYDGRSVSAAISSDGPNLVLTIPDDVTLTLGTFDGFVYHGQSASLWDGAYCEINGVSTPTPGFIDVTVSLATATADPASRNVTASGYNARLVYNFPADACTASTITFTGALNA